MESPTLFSESDADPRRRPSRGADVPALSESTWWVVCLCAGWCGTCRDYGPMFASLAAAQPGVRFEWVDIEDEADIPGDLEVETFPTILIGQGDRVRFMGPLLPQIAVLGRLITSLQTSPANLKGEGGSEAQAVFDRLRRARTSSPD